MKKKIAIFTGNRAEYGLQKPILQALKDNSNTNYYLIVSGSHLEKKFGKTINEIKKDKFKISHLIKLKNTKIKNLTYTPIIISELINILTCSSYKEINKCDKEFGKKIYDNIKRIATTKKKDCSGISNKCIFKHMDILEIIKKITLTIN